jgi:SAM-dependent methyltransferase
MQASPMPHSTKLFKDEIRAFLLGKYGPRRTVLDIGCGAGTYGRLLQRNFDVVDAVEIFEPYVAAYGLPSLYRRVFVTDALAFEFDYYDVIVLGDVLEHLTEDDGIRLVERIYDRCDELVVAIPFFSEQHEEHGNAHEVHRQAAITHERFMTRYKGFVPYCLRYDYGVYVKDVPPNRGIEAVTDAFYLEEATRIVRGQHTVTLVTAALTDEDAAAREPLLRTPANLIVFAPFAIGARIRAARSGRATEVVSRERAQTPRDFPFRDRLTPGHDPFALETMFRLHDAACVDTFTSTHLYWVGAGAPPPATIAAWSDEAPDTFVCGPSFFGGPKSVLRKASELYYSLLGASLDRGWNGDPMVLLSTTYPNLFRTVVA